MRRWVPVLIVSTPFTAPRPDWSRPVRWFWLAYVITRIRAWYADYLSEQYRSEEIGLQYGVADRLLLTGTSREIVDRLAADGGHLAIASSKDEGQLYIATEKRT